MREAEMRALYDTRGNTEKTFTTPFPPKLSVGTPALSPLYTRGNRGCRLVDQGPPSQRRYEANRTGERLQATSSVWSKAELIRRLTYIQRLAQQEHYAEIDRLLREHYV